MPPYIRRRRSWDWFTPADLTHLPVSVRKRLDETARRNVEGDRSDQRAGCLFAACIMVVLFLICAGGTTAEYLRETIDYSSPSAPLEYEAYLVSKDLFMLGAYGFTVVLVCLPLYEMIKSRQLYRRYLRELMLAEGIRPRLCFECRYYVEGFEGSECPNCDAALVRTPHVSPPEPPALG